MRILFVVAAAIASIAASAQVACITCVDQNTPITTGLPNLLLNGGFESTPCPPAGGFIGDLTSFCPNSIGYACDIDNWICTGGGTETYACVQNSVSTFVPEGALAVYFGNFYCDVCPGAGDDTLCLVDDGCEVTGLPAGYPESGPTFGTTTGVSLEQTVTGLAVGQLYGLEFWAGGEEQGFGRGIFAVDVGFGKIYLHCWATDGSPDQVGTRYTIFFIADSPSHTIRFTNWGHITTNAPELILDDVKLYVASGSSTEDPCATGIGPAAHEGLEVIRTSDGWMMRAPGQGEQQLRLCDITGRSLLYRTFTGTTTIPADLLHPGAHLCTVWDESGRSWSTVLVADR